MLHINSDFPSWSWASVGFERIRHHLTGVDSGWTLLANIRDIQIVLKATTSRLGRDEVVASP